MDVTHLKKPLIKYHHKKCWAAGQGGILVFFFSLSALGQKSAK